MRSTPHSLPVRLRKASCSGEYPLASSPPLAAGGAAEAAEARAAAPRRAPRAGLAGVGEASGATRVEGKKGLEGSVGSMGAGLAAGGLGERKEGRAARLAAAFLGAAVVATAAPLPKPMAAATLARPEGLASCGHGSRGAERHNVSEWPAQQP